jgi:hypothetical protein
MKRLSKIFLLLLLPALLWLFVNATLNRHNHYLTGGYIISHAHPYDHTPSHPEPFRPHHHSDTELFLLNLVSDPATATLFVFMLLLFLLAVLQVFLYRNVTAVHINRLYQVRNYHAPPGF